MNEQELKQYLSDYVLEFATKMNMLEHDIFMQSQTDKETDWFEEYNKRYLPMFEVYCTQKKRVYGGKKNSFGSPSQYNGIETSHEIIVDFKNERKAEVVFKTETKELGNTQYLFVVVKKKDGWKIDSYKRWSNWKQKWVNGIL